MCFCWISVQLEKQKFYQWSLSRIYWCLKKSCPTRWISIWRCPGQLSPSMQVRYAHYHVTFEQNWLTFKDTTTLRPRQCKMSYHLLGPTKEPFTEQTLERGSENFNSFCLDILSYFENTYSEHTCLNPWPFARLWTVYRRQSLFVTAFSFGLQSPWRPFVFVCPAPAPGRWNGRGWGALDEPRRRGCPRAPAIQAGHS